MAVLFLSVGASLAYVCILGDVFSSLIPSLSRTQAILAIASLVLMPLVLLRDLSALSFSSILGFAAVMYTAVFVVLRAVDGTYAEGGKYIESLALAPGTFAADVGDVLCKTRRAGRACPRNMDFHNDAPGPLV